MTPELAKKLVSDEELIQHLPSPTYLAAAKGIRTEEDFDNFADFIRMALAKEKLEGVVRSQYDKE
jgi:hypothetical protein